MASRFQNVPAFKPTGRGYFNKLPDFSAGPHNANGIFTNLGKNVHETNHTLYSFVTAVSTGWAVAGSYGQSPPARTFYPTNLSQSELTVTGIVANQYEYDKIVAFTQAHHHSSIDKNDQDGIEGTRAVDFKLLPYRIPIGTQEGVTRYHYVHRGMHLRGYITHITAGHQRFINAPTWEMTFRISDDFLQEPVNLKGEFNRILYKNYLGLFGSFYKGPKITGAVPVPPNNTDGFSPTNPDLDFWHQFGDS